MFGELVVAVLSQEGKQYALPPEKRAEMLRKITAGMPGVTVVCSTGLLVDLMAQVGADVILRGVRDAGDVREEMQIAQAHRMLGG